MYFLYLDSYLYFVPLYLLSTCIHKYAIYLYFIQTLKNQTKLRAGAYPNGWGEYGFSAGWDSGWVWGEWGCWLAAGCAEWDNDWDNGTPASTALLGVLLRIIIYTIQLTSTDRRRQLLSMSERKNLKTNQRKNNVKCSIQQTKLPENVPSAKEAIPNLYVTWMNTNWRCTLKGCF